MLSAQAFVLLNLALYGVILVAIGVAERRGRGVYRSRDRRVRYRRLSTDAALRRIRRETRRAGDASRLPCPSGRSGPSFGRSRKG